MRRIECGVGEPPRVSRLRCVRSEFEPVELALKSEFAFASRQSPRTALAPAILGLRRAAEARKLQRIARRFAALAGVNRGTAYGQDEGAERALVE